MERLTELKYYITKLDAKIKNLQECIEKMAFDDKAEVGVKFLASTVSYLKELREYKQLEEQGLLLRLPCKAGSTVYLIRSRYTECSKYKETWNDCFGCEYEDKCDSHEEYYIHINHSVSDEWIVRYMNDFGKTVFLTKAEAEQKLKEMEM